MKKLPQYFQSFIKDNGRWSRPALVALFLVSICTLLATSYYVAEKSSIIHSNNHDQLIDGYMFEDVDTFRQALFPAAHTFLLKWPLFVVSSLFGNTPLAYTILTIAVYLMTISAFLYITYLLSRKDRLITSFIALTLSSILLFVPAQPFDASLLPVNMAMITTRNLEFLVFFLYIYLIIKAQRVNSLSFYLSIVVLGLLGATDKFFLMLALVAAVIYIFYQFVYINKAFTKQVIIPLLASISAYILSTALLIMINKFGITGIPQPTTSAPFALVSSMWQMLEAIAGALQGILVNYGAGFFNRAANLSLLPYAINGLILLASIYAAHRLFFKKDIAGSHATASEWKFVLWLVLTLLAAIIIFIASNHDYLYDGRYLTGSLFAGIGALTYFLAKHLPQKARIFLLLATVFLLLLTPFALLTARKNFTQAIHSNEQALGIRTTHAAAIIKNEDADILMGDYWFITAAKLKVTHKDIEIAPMSTDTCDTPNTYLTSKKWYNATSHVDRSAYYILRDGGENAQTFNHGCTLEHLNKKYGQAEKEYIIRGTEEQPIDIIRIYSYDIREKLTISY